MKKNLKLIFLIFSSLQLTAQNKSDAKLIVSIVVDQMRTDYLTRFANLYEGGFKTLMEEGQVFWNAHYSHVPTYTAPGHASIYTGTDPRFHGLIANDWYVVDSGKTSYCVEDKNAMPIGTASNYAKRSPKNILSTTWTDELEWVSNRKSKIFAFSLKDRGAICAAGHLGDAAFWLDKKGFISSSYYMKKLPKWLENFNKKNDIQSYMSGKWDYLINKDNYPSPNTSEFERIPKGARNADFPYELEQLYNSDTTYTEAFKGTPQGNQILIDVAIEALKNEKLGIHNNPYPDVLAISFSSTDYLGHSTGIRSHEIIDMYLRLDRQLNTLFNYLNKKIGEDNFIIVLTADHGAADNPSQARMDGMTTDWIAPADLENECRKLILNAGINNEDVLNFSNEQIYIQINDKSNPVNAENKRKIVRDAILSHPAIMEAWTKEDIQRASDPFSIMRKNGSNKLSGDVFFSLYPGSIIYSKTGTTHGSGYTYDTNVPIIFFGRKSLSSQNHIERVNVKDIAPTLSYMFGLSLPSACNGNILPLNYN